MSDFWSGNPAYQEYKAARWRKDRQLAAQLVEAGLTSSDPGERAHWLVAKASLYADVGALPGNMDVAWNCLSKALAAAPDHYSLRRGALIVALAMVSYEGSRSGLAEVLRLLRPELHRLLREPGISYNIGTLRYGAGKWRQAHLWLNRAFAAGYVSSGGEAGQAVPLSVKAVVTARLGRLSEAEALLQEACQRFETYGKDWPVPSALVVARAEIELANGRPQAARSLMQQFLSSPEATRPISVVRLNMLAAEIALAEGNQAGYRHYCDLALGACHEHGLTISIHFVRTVMAAAQKRHFSGTAG